MNLVILDADVIIYLYQLGKFLKVIKKNRIIIPATIASQANYYNDPSSGEIITINLSIKHANFEIVEDVSIDNVELLKKTLRGVPIPELHEGEISGIILTKNNHDYKFCTGDGAALIVLGLLGMKNQAISVEELLRSDKGLRYNFTRKSLEEQIKKGQTLRVQYEVDL